MTVLTRSRKIPVSVIVITKNEESRIERCLRHLRNFAEVVVVDSQSVDRTRALAEKHGARVVDFAWNRRYPKKRQWCLDILDLAHDWVFFVDADEVLTPELIDELYTIDYTCAGYFIRGRYVFWDVVLKHGLQNNKLALINRNKIEFPVVNDLGVPGMGEIEGHYQPVLKPGYEREFLGQLEAPMQHYACYDMDEWAERHKRYAQWERGMNIRRAWPKDPVKSRNVAKALFRWMPFRPELAFAHSYFWKQGFRDGREGFRFAQSRAAYYRMISRASKRAA